MLPKAKFNLFIENMECQLFWFAFLKRTLDHKLALVLGKHKASGCYHPEPPRNTNIPHSSTPEIWDIGEYFGDCLTPAAHSL